MREIDQMRANLGAALSANSEKVPSESERQRSEELQAVMRCATQVDPDAAWVVIKGRLDEKGDINGVFFGATFGAGDAIAEVMEAAATIARAKPPDKMIDNRPGKEKLG